MAERDIEEFKNQVEVAQEEVVSTKKYAEVIECRFKERAREEEVANRKVLALLD